MSFCADFGDPYPSPIVALDRGVDEVTEHTTALIRDRQRRAQMKIIGARRDVTPADLMFDYG